jgi:hypothetical protein
MTGVFQNIEPPPPLTAWRVCTPRLWCGGRTFDIKFFFRKSRREAVQQSSIYDGKLSKGPCTNDMIRKVTMICSEKLPIQW